MKSEFLYFKSILNAISYKIAFVQNYAIKKLLPCEIFHIDKEILCYFNKHVHWKGQDLLTKGINTQCSSDNQNVINETVYTKTHKNIEKDRFAVYKSLKVLFARK